MRVDLKYMYIVSVLRTVLTSTGATEKCLQYQCTNSYLEKLLEVKEEDNTAKITWLERQNEELSWKVRGQYTEIKENRARLDQLNTTKQERQTEHVLLEKIKAINMSMAEVVNMNEQLKVLVKELQKENKQLNKSLEQLRLTEQKISQSSPWQTYPAFLVKMNSILHYPQFATIHFDDVLFNVNNVYNTTVSKFVATVRGRYLFSVAARANVAGRCSPGIYKNGSKQAHAVSGADPIHWSGSGSVSIVLDLKVGDEVYVDEVGKNSEYRYAVFTGVLLYPFE